MKVLVVIHVQVYSDGAGEQRKMTHESFEYVKKNLDEKKLLKTLEDLKEKNLEEVRETVNERYSRICAFVHQVVMLP